MFLYFLIVIFVLTPDASAILCYSCDGSKDLLCKETWSLDFNALQVECDSMCYSAIRPDQNIKRGCAEFVSALWDVTGLSGTYICPGIEGEERCHKCETELCNNAAKHPVFVILFLLTGIIILF